MDLALRPSRQNTSAVVVSYFPDESLLDHLDAILDEVSEVLLVDNASTGETRRVVEAAGLKQGVSLHQNQENLGLGAALNTGFRWAAAQGYSFVMTFDQDTHPLKGLLETYARIYDVVDNQSVGCVGANYRDPHTGAQLISEGQCVGKSFAPVDLLITSGTLVPIPLFERAGGYREDYFVDLTDHEMCLRTQSLGYHHYVSVPVGLIHSLGFPTIHTFMGFHWIAYNYSPLRYYYMARNFMLMFPMRRCEGGGGNWGLSMVIPVVRRLLTFMLSESSKIKKVYAMVLGILHAILGKTGRLESQILNRRGLDR